MKFRTSRSEFGTLPDGSTAELFTMEADGGLRVSFTNYGGAIVSLFAPDARGEYRDVVLGFDTLEGYLQNKAYHGALIGRCANRIAAGRFVLGGVEYPLAVNNGPNHLHGGDVGFDRRLWTAKFHEEGRFPALDLSLISSDGDEGYPGRVEVSARYSLPDRHTLQIDYRAATDRPTPVNLTNHAYFNLAGHDAGSVLDHELTVRASHFTPTDETSIPTGEFLPTAGTPFDFAQPHRIGERIENDDLQLRQARGYDHNFVLDGSGLRSVAQVVERTSGRTLKVLTTEPGLQFYTGNYLDGTEPGKGGAAYPFRGGLCLETQRFPDSVNQRAFPSAILHPGQTFLSTTAYRFGTL